MVFAMDRLLAAIVVSACLGALVGLVRQWSDRDAVSGQPADLSGIRTFSLWGVLGCVAAHLGESFSPALLPVVLGLIGLHAIAPLFRAVGNGAAGQTSFVAMLLTCLAGVLVQRGSTQTAVLVATTTLLVIGLKQPIRTWIGRFTADDMRATLQFAAITGVILPLVPDRAFGPFGAFNPYSTWLMVVLISGLGFAGYLAMRLLGTRAGIVVTSLFGGLASSTATTLAFSRRSRDEPGFSEPYAVAVAAACSMMLPRVLVALSVLSPALALTLVAPFALMALPAVGYGAWLWFARRPGHHSVENPALANPLSLKTAVKFALLYAGIGFLVKAATSMQLLHSGLLPLSFVSGLTDMDAISLSVAGGHAGGTVPLTLAARAILVAAIANSLLKAALCAGLGSPELRRKAGGVLVATALAGAGGMLLVG